jgi:2-keto-3-deoxy-galactonokinase
LTAVLAIDQGTTSTRGFVASPDGRFIRFSPGATASSTRGRAGSSTIRGTPGQPARLP